MGQTCARGTAVFAALVGSTAELLDAFSSVLPVLSSSMSGPTAAAPAAPLLQV
jgi:hypothetical protein